MILEQNDWSKHGDWNKYVVHNIMNYATHFCPPVLYIHQEEEEFVVHFLRLFRNTSNSAIKISFFQSSGKKLGRSFFRILDRVLKSWYTSCTFLVIFGH